MDITREQEDEAFDKLRSKLDRVHPSNRLDNPSLMIKATYQELAAIMQFYRRSS
jgi:hypothetical protein